MVKKALVTNVLFYNGQPLDTGLMCHGAGHTSCTSAIQKDKEGCRMVTPWAIRAMDCASCFLWPLHLVW